MNEGERIFSCIEPTANPHRPEMKGRQYAQEEYSSTDSSQLHWLQHDVLHGEFAQHTQATTRRVLRCIRTSELSAVSAEDALMNPAVGRTRLGTKR